MSEEKGNVKDVVVEKGSGSVCYKHCLGYKSTSDGVYVMENSSAFS